MDLGCPGGVLDSPCVAVQGPVSLWNVTMVFLVWPSGRGLVAELLGWLEAGHVMSDFYAERVLLVTAFYTNPRLTASV